MLALDLFNTRYERQLQEGGVDNLEARRIDDLNMRMLELLDRAKEPAYKKNPAALAGLKKQFQQIKDERDSYFKINPATGMNDAGTLGTVKGALDELGIPGSVPTEKIPGKEDLLKGRGRSYYEDQKKSSETVDEHGGGIGPKQHWQDLMPEQTNPEDDDWYDDEDQDLRLRSGDYVRDQQDGESGEIFRMQGDPYERRVRILDRDGKGWYIEPSRLTRVDPTDPDVQRYFGKNRQRDMDEAVDEKGALKAAQAAAKFIIRNLDDRAALKYYSQDFWSPEKFYQGATMAMRGAGIDEIVRHITQDRPAQFEEGWSDAVLARRTGTPRTSFSVYIKGKKWKDFESDDHAEAVANKLRAKFKAEGRDPSVITVAPTDMSEAKATKTRLDPKCWTGKKIGNPKTKVKGGVRVNNCVPAESVTEDQDTSGVERAILNRIMVAHTDLLMQFGPDKVMQAAEEVAYNVGDVDEIGTSDISAYVQQVRQILGA
jgi:hypothetical protein